MRDQRRLHHQRMVPQSQITLVKNPNLPRRRQVKGSTRSATTRPRTSPCGSLKALSAAGRARRTYDVPSDQIKWLEKNMRTEFQRLALFRHVLSMSST